MLLAVMVTAVFGHPHVAITATIELVYAGRECSGFWQEWIFDAVFSAMVRNDFDANRDGRFDAAEQAAIHDGAFINLRKYGFFTLIRRGNLRTSPDAVQDFSAAIRNDRVVYRFFVPLKDQGYSADFSLAIFDTTFYCNIEYAATPVTVSQRQAGAAIPTISRSVNKNFPVYYNPADPPGVNKIYTAWAPGLQTAWPEELHVSWAR